MIPRSRWHGSSARDRRRGHRQPRFRFPNPQIRIAGPQLLDAPVTSTTILLRPNQISQPVGTAVATHFLNPNGIASYLRVILLSHDTPRSWVEPGNLDRFYHHFRSFSAVERLVISGLETTKFDPTSTPRYFANFAATVRSLELRTAVGDPASLVSFICAFPFVDDLAIEYPSATGSGGNHEGVVDLASMPTFRGKVRLLDMFHESNPLVEFLCALPLRFHTIWVSSRDTGRLPQLAKLVTKCGKTLRSLHIIRKARGAVFTHPLIPRRRLSTIQWVFWG